MNNEDNKETNEDSTNEADISALYPKNLDSTLEKLDDGFTKVQNKRQKNLKQTNIPTDQSTWTDIRYGYMVKLPATDEPLKKFAETLKKLLKLLQEQVHKNLYLGMWNPSDQPDATQYWKTPKDIPAGNIADRMHFFNFCGKYVNPARKKEDKLFLKIRLVTPTPQALPIPLKDIGKELSELIEEKLNVKIFKNPYACQAAKTATMGWLWGSTKSMADDVLTPAIKKELNIPSTVAFGIQWRTIKEANGYNYKWGDNDSPPPQALHLDIGHNFSGTFSEKAANLWKKGAQKKILSLHLHIFHALEHRKRPQWMTNKR